MAPNYEYESEYRTASMKQPPYIQAEYENDEIEREVEISREMNRLRETVLEVDAMSRQLEKYFASILRGKMEKDGGGVPEQTVNTKLGSEIADIRHIAESTINQLQDMMNRREI